MALAALAGTAASTSAYAAATRMRIAALFALAVVASVVGASIVPALELGSVVVVVYALALVAIVWRPSLGLYGIVALVAFFEPGGADAVMELGRWLYGGFSSTLGLREVIFSPLEILLALALAGWLAHGVMTRDLRFRGGLLGLPVLLFALALTVGFLRGALPGGNLNIALWESRFLVYVLICYVLACNLIRTRHDVNVLVTILVVATGLFAFEGAYRRVALIDTGSLGVAAEFAYAHDSTVFLAVVLLLVLAQPLLGAPGWQRALALAVAPVAAFTLLATERRAGMLALIAGLLVLVIVTVAWRPRRFWSVVVPLVMIGLLYLAAFWNSSGLIGQPARAIRSVFQPDARDFYSNLYRFLETINVRATIRATPLLGVGFGREYFFVVPLPDLSWWPFWHYEPHNTILWIWLKTGVFGFVAFWSLMGRALARAAHFAKTLGSGELRTFAALALCGLTAALAFSYVDLGLVSPRVTVLMGTLLGALAVLDRIDAAPAPRGRAT